ncbi:hypothetical protein DF3PA_280017 [Candidatus Defluviicoccus seviourii]|uniref:Uncharacterized protein n=1 Tax=Candidatus Defluviicoccus seviourii TaxID=2565273 RepID=A0A564WE49_9PROT|nr:hypothetical protein DF3PA_280017 [Candidatus Defluviicoccus seviourii]
MGEFRHRAPTPINTLAVLPSFLAIARPFLVPGQRQEAAGRLMIYATVSAHGAKEQSK